MLEYLLKVSFLIGVAFLFYKFVLQQESFFSTNRWFLISSFVLAFGLPFVTLPQLVEHQGIIASLFQPSVEDIEDAPTPVSHPTTLQVIEAQATADLPEVRKEPSPVAEVQTQAQANTAPAKPAAEKVAPATQKGWSFWVAMFYFFGVGVFALNLLFQIGGVLLKAFRSTDKVEDGDYVIVTTESRQAPCSFFKYIFIYPDDYDFDTYEQIIAHEKIHVRQGHTFDLLIAELAVIVLWFNPLVWLYKKEVEKNIEYQTDAILLGEEQVSADKYQLSLLQIACPHKPLSITTNYNQSLLKQRIYMMNAKKSTLYAYWKYTFLAPLFFGSLLLLNEPAISQNLLTTNSLAIEESTTSAPVTQQETEVIRENVKEKLSVVTSETPNPAPAPSAAPNPAAPTVSAPISGAELVAMAQDTPRRGNNSFNMLGRQTDMAQGFWYGHTTANQYCMELKGKENTSSWNVSRCFDKKLFSKKGDNVYELKRASGTLQLTGNLDQEVSQGKYTFTEDASFKDFLAKQNISVSAANPNMVFFLFLGDVDKNYVNFLKSNYPDITGQRLQELAIHNITQEDIKGYMAMFKKHNNTTPTLSQVVEAKIFKITEAYVQELESMGYKGLPMSKIVEAKIHKIDATYAVGLRKAGFEALSLDKVIEAKIHKVTPAFIQEMNALGYGNLSLSKIVSLKIHKVDAGYVQELQAAGFKDLSLDKVLEAKIHKVSPTFVKEMNSLGFGNLSLDKVISLKIHKVNAEYVQELKKAGYDNVGLDKVLEAKIHRVTPEFIKEINSLGFKDLSLSKMIEAKIHRLDAEFLNGLKAEGFTNLDYNKAIEARIHGVTGSFIKTAKAEGYNLKTLDEYINVRIMGMARRNKRD